MYCRNHEGSKCQALVSGKLVEVVSDMDSDSHSMLVSNSEPIYNNCSLNDQAFSSSSSSLCSPEKIQMRKMLVKVGALFYSV